MASAVAIANKVTTEEIAASDASVLRFDSTAAESTLSVVKANFGAVKNELGEYQRDFNSLDWDSPAAEQFNSKFEAISNNLRESFDNICSLFETEIKNASEEMEKADSSTMLDNFRVSIYFE